MDRVTKATKAIIKLGAIEIDVYQLPNGEYKYSLTQAFISIADGGYDTRQAAKRSIEIIESKQGQLLAPKGFQSIEEIKNPDGKGNLKLISQADVSILWTIATLNGNTKAAALLAAVAEEALERRADSAFGVARSEEERNARLEARMKGKLTRRTLTDAIQSWIEANNPSDNYRKWAYANCTDQINLAIFGDRASKLKAKLDIKQIRDACNVKQIKELDYIEEAICREIEDGGLEPLEATKFVLATRYVRSLPLV